MVSVVVVCRGVGCLGQLSGKRVVGWWCCLRTDTGVLGPQGCNSLEDMNQTCWSWIPVVDTGLKVGTCRRLMVGRP